MNCSNNFRDDGKCYNLPIIVIGNTDSTQGRFTFGGHRKS
jgi:hypothetical protein